MKTVTVFLTAHWAILKMADTTTWTNLTNAGMEFRQVQIPLSAQADEVQRIFLEAFPILVSGGLFFVWVRKGRGRGLKIKFHELASMDIM